MIVSSYLTVHCAWILAPQSTYRTYKGKNFYLYILQDRKQESAYGEKMVEILILILAFESRKLSGIFGWCLKGITSGFHIPWSCQSIFYRGWENYGLGVKGQSCLGLVFCPCHLLYETLSHAFLGISFLMYKRGNGSSLSACFSWLTWGWGELFHM